jgi:hypothetical protein
MPRPALYLVTERYRMPNRGRLVQVRVFVVLADSKAAACAKMARAEGNDPAVRSRTAKRCGAAFVLHMVFSTAATPADRRTR